MKIPRQPEINIGTAGHVDHGKCLTLENKALVDGHEIDGWDVLSSFGGSAMGESLGLSPIITLGLSGNSLSEVNAFPFIQPYKGVVVKVETESGRRIRATPDHGFLTPTGWKRAAELAENERLLSFDKRFEWDTISSLKSEGYAGFVYDLAVPAVHNFLLSNGIITHNTTLVEAITGKWTSMHSEELRRGITIKVGYADAAIYECPGISPPANFNTDGTCDGKEAKLRRVVSFVDSPGHESLMSVMLSGAAIMDGAVLVIAANEQVPQPQTREHLQALKMIGVKNIVVAQNKVDLVTYNEALNNYNKIVDFLSSYGYRDVPIVPVSAQKRLNIDALIEAIEDAIPTPQRDLNSPPLMQVLRSFDINKPGTEVKDLRGGILGGSLKRGKLKVGDEIEIKPGIPLRDRFKPVRTKVVSLGTSAGLVDEVHPGGLIAIGTPLDPVFTKNDIMVGNYISLPGELPNPTKEIMLKYELFQYIIGLKELVRSERLRTGEALKLNIGTLAVNGVVAEVTNEFIRIELRRPAVAIPGDKVAISRLISERWRLAGMGYVQ